MLFPRLDSAQIEAFAAGVEQYSTCTQGGESSLAAAAPSVAKKEKHAGLCFMSIAGNAASLHAAHPNSVNMVASQFNCLEMVGPGERPEDGITQYYRDKTQGYIYIYRKR